MVQAEPPGPVKLQMAAAPTNILTTTSDTPRAGTTQRGCSQIPDPQKPYQRKMFTVVFKSLSLGVTYYGAIDHSLTSHKEPSLVMFSLCSQMDWIHYKCIASGPLVGPERIF